MTATLNQLCYVSVCVSARAWCMCGRARACTHVLPGAVSVPRAERDDRRPVYTEQPAARPAPRTMRAAIVAHRRHCCAGERPNNRPFFAPCTLRCRPKTDVCRRPRRPPTSIITPTVADTPLQPPTPRPTPPRPTVIGTNWRLARTTTGYNDAFEASTIRNVVTWTGGCIYKTARIITLIVQCTFMLLIMLYTPITLNFAHQIIMSQPMYTDEGNLQLHKYQ